MSTAGPAARERLRVLVLRGGRSSEHEVSLRSADSVLEHLDQDRYDVRAVTIGRDGRWHDEDGAPVALALGDARPLGDVDVVLPVLHGPFGEDGTVQGLLEMAGIAYVGSGVVGAGLTMDKDMTKAVLRDAGIPVAASLTLRRGRDEARAAATRARVEERFAYPVFVKPARLGSSVGISKVSTGEELGAALELAFRHDEKALVEEFLAGAELECGVLGNEQPIASEVGRIVVQTGEWYDYEAKYGAGGSDLLVPADIPAEAAAELRRLALEAFRATDCAGMARIDFFRTSDGRIVLNEINTIPGFTATSYYARLFAASGVPYRELLDQLIALAVERAERARTLAF